MGALLLLAVPPLLVLLVFIVLLAMVCTSALHHLGPYMVPQVMRAAFELLAMLTEIKVHHFRRSGTTWSFVDMVEDRVDEYPRCVQFIQAETGEQMTLASVDRLANQVANWGLCTLRLQQHDSVCLMMHNNCQYVSIWLGMGKIGVSTALLNTNITGGPLCHSIDVALKNSRQKVLIIDSGLATGLACDIKELQDRGVCVYFWDSLYDPLKGDISAASAERPPRSSRNLVKESDPLVFIFTSGTTGLPKAARISSTRLRMMTLPCRKMGYLREGESRMYCCLPLYHSAGGLLGAGSALLSGCTLVMRKKFSARTFTADILRYRCNSAQYIGELCRYLLMAPQNSQDNILDIHYVFGNGMRQDVWIPFMKRYGVRRVVEFYSATEANIGLFNSTGQVGSLGCIPRVLDFIYPVLILRVDPEHRDTPMRTNGGLCIVAEPNETGLVVSKISSSPLGRFEGYSDKVESSKKILNNVLEVGDQYFNSGDLLRRDLFGFFYWADRVGDTFRWKGENVATTEVEHVLASLTFVSDLCVYGVEIPKYDGRCGMVAMTLAGSGTETVPNLLAKIDWATFHSVCSLNLPIYSRPRFIRVMSGELQTTGTFKHQKNILVKAGFNPAGDAILQSGDTIFFYNPKDGSLIPLGAELHADILSGNIKL